MGSCPNLVTFCHFFNREFSRFEHLAAPICCTPLGISSMALLQNKSLFQVLRVVPDPGLSQVFLGRPAVRTP